jgi:hypothetical protein
MNCNNKYFNCLARNEILGEYDKNIFYPELYAYKSVYQKHVSSNPKSTETVTLQTFLKQK